MNVKLLVIAGENAGMEISVSTPEFLIGRGESCHLRSQSEQVGRRHCVISVGRESIAIEDCGSGQETLLNGKELRWRRELHEGDQITVGTLVLEVRLETSGKEQQGQHIQVATQTAAGSDEQEVQVVRWVKEAQEAGAQDRGIRETGTYLSPSDEGGDSPHVASSAGTEAAVAEDSGSGEVTASSQAALRIMRRLVASSAVARASAARVGLGLVAIVLSVRQIPMRILDASYAALVEGRWHHGADARRSTLRRSEQTRRGSAHDRKESVGPVDTIETTGAVQGVSKNAETEAIWQHVSLRKTSQPEPDATIADLPSDVQTVDESTMPAMPVMPVARPRHVEPVAIEAQREEERQASPHEASREWDRTDRVLMTVVGLMAVGVLAVLAPMVWPWFLRTFKRHGWPWWAWIVQGVVLFALAFALHIRQMRRNR